MVYKSDVVPEMVHRGDSARAPHSLKCLPKCGTFPNVRAEHAGKEMYKKGDAKNDRRNIRWNPRSHSDSGWTDSFSTLLILHLDFCGKLPPLHSTPPPEPPPLGDGVGHVSVPPPSARLSVRAARSHHQTLNCVNTVRGSENFCLLTVQVLSPPLPPSLPFLPFQIR